MKIAQIAPLMESVPPKLYGGTERIVSYLTEELVRQGHDVTLFASGDSSTSAELVACCDTALRLNPNAHNHIPYHVMMLERVRRRADEFDVLHFHVDVLHFPIIREFARRTVTTLHGRLDLPDLAQLYAMFDDIPLVSISNDQRRPMPPVNWLGTVYHGLPLAILPFQPKASGYLAFLGRISPEKGPEVAMEIAARAGMPLKIAAKIDAVDQSFWSKKVEPQLLRNSKVEFIGEIDERQKAEFLGNATALLFPIDWPEPFGLVTIEAMACGTPVIAFNRGAVPEVIDDGVSGLIVESVDEAVEALRRIGGLDRARVRKAFEKRFTVERMCSDYLAIYHSLARDQRFSLGSRNGFAAQANAVTSPVSGVLAV
ncbi:glycosyltransferase family 4 protein [Mesorhizobium sp. B283B1A]|uniref:glycosyltransferase family 4 protein n=1 Tax=Mesorhizobium TaxID=68287 RepID=UPI001CD174BB|nr:MULTISPECIES: glycosyltransferase family 4 protein [Mesorhizobium]MCA0049080.1 glycosyltransferase family 4 protein [Mesorhizobium sp. B283B1A]UQS68083.1 glycosyltransferase family 4 protein [Mesorhizobium opportunistum]